MILKYFMHFIYMYIYYMYIITYIMYINFIQILIYVCILKKNVNTIKRTRAFYETYLNSSNIGALRGVIAKSPRTWITKFWLSESFLVAYRDVEIKIEKEKDPHKEKEGEKDRERNRLLLSLKYRSCVARKHNSRDVSGDLVV